MHKFLEFDPLRDPREVDWELDTARNYGVAPYPNPADVAVTVTYGSVSIDGTNCANVDVYYKDGRVEKRLEPYSGIIAGEFDRPKASDDDDDLGYHNLRASDL